MLGRSGGGGDGEKEGPIPAASTLCSLDSSSRSAGPYRRRLVRQDRPAHNHASVSLSNEGRVAPMARSPCVALKRRRIILARVATSQPKRHHDDLE